MSLVNLDNFSGLPVDEEGPVFKAPWEAQAFALVVKLHEQGVFTWQEWAEQLGNKIAAARSRGDPDLGNTYYEHWLAALEAIASAKGLVTPETLVKRKKLIHLEHKRLHG